MTALYPCAWDTHGLPVELEVEKLLGLDGKEQIEEYGLDPFISKCKESVWKYKGMWEDFSGTVGFWADMYCCTVYCAKKPRPVKGRGQCSR